jgi:hypothetical protein
MNLEFRKRTVIYTMSFYDELMAHSQDNMDKTASVKDSIDLRKELEDVGMAAGQMEVLAKSILGFMSKKADEVQDDNLEDIVDQDNPAAAPVDPAVDAAAAVSADDQVKADATDAAVASAKASIDDAASAIDTLSAITSGAPEGTIPPEAPVEAPVEVPGDSAATTSDDNQVIAAEDEKGTEKAKEDDKDDSDDSDDSDEEEEEEHEAALAEYNQIMKEGTEEEKLALVNDAYDIAMVKIARAGYTLDDFVLSRVGDYDLSDTIVDQSYKLAALSGQNPMKIADDIVYNMEKSASEF